MKEILNIDELSEYLGIKTSSLYSKVERKEIPFYKIGHLVRFKKSDIDLWIEKFKSEPLRAKDKTKSIRHSEDARVAEINEIVKRAIADSQGMKYTPNHKGDRTRIRGLRKEVEDAI
ncbi:MAG: helix-turn-helix domain-containing protein [Thermodesulfobacteriota bacterium]